MKPLEPRSVFVSGASRGLGRAFAEYWLSRGADVWGTARNADALVDLAKHPAFRPVIFDLRDREGVLAAFTQAEKAAGGFDLVVNNAGYGLFGELTAIEAAQWEDQLTSMLTHLMVLVRRQVQLLKDRGRNSCLVNVSSLAVEFPLPFMSGYNVVKAGLSALSESLLMELDGTSVRVVDFRPGDYRTDFNRAMRPVNEESDDSSHLRRAWMALEQNIENAPLPERAAADLHRALAMGRQGIVRSGGAFQAVVAPFLLKIAPERLARAVRWRYFGLQ
ncbi:MAG: SDR family oxidoreductase [Synoicihabitans sp.]